MDLQSKSILIVGLGVLGSRLLPLLAGINLKKIGLVSRDVNQINVSCFQCEVLKFPHFIEDAITSSKLIKIDWDIIIYTAGFWRGKSKLIKDFELNYNPFISLINGLRRPPKKFIYLSSSAVYSKNFSDSIDVDSLPDSSYGAAKLMAEKALISFCLDNEIDYIIFRPFHIASAWEKYELGRSHVLTDFTYKIINKIPVNSYDLKINKIYIPFTWVDDCVHVLLLAACKNDVSGIFNIGARNAYSLFSVYNLINQIVNQGTKHLDDLDVNQVDYFCKSYDFFGNYDVTPIADQIGYILREKLNDKRN